MLTKILFFEKKTRLLLKLTKIINSMKTKLNSILIPFMLLLVQFIFAQEKTVSGIIKDNTGPLPGVGIMIKNTSQGTETDFDGKYTIKVKEGDILIFSFVGMETVEKTVDSSNTINVNLKENDNLLDEVIVVAYGNTTKEALTGSVNVVTSKEIASRNVTSPIAAIEGRATGVQFTTGAGGPGSSPGIVIRGVNTLQGATDPLYIVDGIQFEGALNTINQEDIESFTILKDAASTSLYGSRAANGVVIINTKKGNNGDIKLNFSTQVGLVTSSIPFYDELTPGQYYETMWEALKNSVAGGGDASFASDNIFNSLGYNPFDVANNEIVGLDGKLNPNANLIYDSLDWYDVLQRTGIRKNYNVNLAGGGEKHTVYFSASYLEEESYIIKSKFDRLTTRLNADFDVKDWLKIGGSANIAVTEATAPSSADTASIVNPFGFAKNIGSIYPVYVNDLNGNIVLDASGAPVFDNGEGFSEYNIGSRPISQGRHAIQELLLNDERDKDNTYGFRYYADFKILDGLKFKLNYGVDINEGIEKEYENNIIGDAQPTGRYSETRFRREVKNFTQLLTYDKTFKNTHNVNLTLGHESFDRTFSSIDALATEQTAEGIFEFDNFASPTSIEGSTTNKTLEGYFLRANYNYDNKYYITASARRDGTSVFSTDYRWGTFYALGLSWRIDQEEFIKNISSINKLKLRASFGQVGNDDLQDFFLSQARYSITSNAGSPAILWSEIGNNELVWETTESYDVGLEFTLFNNFLEGSIEYYKKKTNDLLYNLPIALSNGFDEFPSNIGDLENSGLEIGLTGHLVNNKDFKWDLTLQASTFQSEITSLPSPFINDEGKRWDEGVSPYDFYLLHSAGVDPSNGDALFYMYEFDDDGNSIAILDSDGNHETTNDWEETERAYTGDSTIPDLLGSVFNSFTYKDFSLDVLVNYGIGGTVLDNAYSVMMHTGNFGSSYHPDILNAWKEPGDITDVPRLENGSTGQVLTQSTRFLTDASFVSLKNVSLGYNLNNVVTENIGADNVRLSITGENLYVKNARKGLNPQASLDGTSAGNTFNPNRIVSLGLNVSF